MNQVKETNVTVLNSCNTYLQSNGESCYLQVSPIGQLIRKENEIELSFSSIDRKTVRIETYELNKEFTLGCFNDDMICLCSQLEQNRVSLRTPYQRPVLKSRGLKVEEHNDKTVLQKAFQDAEEIEQKKTFLTEEEKFERDSKNRATLYIRNINSKNYWTVDFEPSTDETVGESPVLMSCGLDFVAIVTDCLTLRIVRFNSLQEVPISLSKRPVTLQAQGQSVLIVFSDLSYSLYQVLDTLSSSKSCPVVQIKQGNLPLSLYSKEIELKWCGSSEDDNIVVVYNTRETFCFFSSTKSWCYVQRVPRHFWTIGLTGNTLLGYKTNNKDFVTVSEQKIIERIPLQLKILGFDATNPSKVGSLKHKLELQALSATVFNNRYQDKEIDGINLKHILLSCKLKKWNRAIGLLNKVKSRAVFDKAKSIILSSCENETLLERVENISKKFSNTGQELKKNNYLERSVGSPSFQYTPREEILKTTNHRKLETPILTPQLKRVSTFGITARESSAKKHKFL